MALNFARGASNAANSQTSSITSASREPAGAKFNPLALTTVLVNQPYSQRTNCQLGGYQETIGRVTGVIDADAAVTNLSMQGTTTIHDYLCLQGWSINGDPYLSHTGTITVTAGRASFSFGQFLGWSATNLTSGAIIRCQEDMRVAWDDRTGGRVQGRMDCSPGNKSTEVNMTF
jgi:hypothetical protein